MRRSLARCAITFTSARVGRRNVSRSVSRTQLLASRKAGVGMSCNIGGLLEGSSWTVAHVLTAHAQQKGEAGFPPPLEPYLTPPVQQDPADSTMSTVYSAASAIGTTDTKVRPLPFARNSTCPSILAKRV